MKTHWKPTKLSKPSSSGPFRHCHWFLYSFPTILVFFWARRHVNCYPQGRWNLPLPPALSNSAPPRVTYPVFASSNHRKHSRVLRYLPVVRTASFDKSDSVGWKQIPHEFTRLLITLRELSLLCCARLLEVFQKQLSPVPFNQKCYGLNMSKCCLYWF